MKPQLWAQPFRCLQAQLIGGLWPSVTLCCLCQSGRTQWLQQGLHLCPQRPHLPAALMTLPGTTVHSGHLLQYVHWQTAASHLCGCHILQIQLVQQPLLPL